MKDLIYSESGNLPNWAKNGKEYWETTNPKKNRLKWNFKKGKEAKNCSVRKYRFALPNEMTDEEMINFTKEYLKENFKDLPIPSLSIEKPQRFMKKKIPMST